MSKKRFGLIVRGRHIMAAEVLDRPHITFERQPLGELSVTEANLYHPEANERLSLPSLEAELGTVATQNTMELESVPYTSVASSETPAVKEYEPRRSSRILDAITASRVGKFALPAAATLAFAGTAEASTPAEITQQKTTLEIQVARSTVSNDDFSKATVLGNHRTISRAKMRQAERKGDCVTIDGSEQNVWVQGRQESGRPYGIDTRTSRFCKWGNNWYRKACGNLAKFKPPRERIMGPIIWVNNFSKAKLTVSAKSEATAYAKCETANTFASAYGHGEGEASARIRIKNALKAKGAKLKELITKQSLEASGEAQSSARADASAQCQEKTVVTLPPPPPEVVVPPPEKPPQPPPPKPPEKPKFPPHADVVGPQHVLVGGEVQICAYESDPDNDIISRNFSETGNGNFISQVFMGDEAGEWCINYKAGTTADNATVTYAVQDAAGNSASDSESFPIYDGPEGQF